MDPFGEKQISIWQANHPEFVTIEHQMDFCVITKDECNETWKVICRTLPICRRPSGTQSPSLTIYTKCTLRKIKKGCRTRFGVISDWWMMCSSPTIACLPRTTMKSAHGNVSLKSLLLHSLLSLKPHPAWSRAVLHRKFFCKERFFLWQKVQGRDKKQTSDLVWTLPWRDNRQHTSFSGKSCFCWQVSAKM